jgi:hypothetical protein
MALFGYYFFVSYHETAMSVALTKDIRSFQQNQMPYEITPGGANSLQELLLPQMREVHNVLSRFEGTS